MRTKAILFIQFTFLLCGLLLTEASSDIWVQADREILRLHPKIFANLSDSILKELQERGCGIPQSYGSSEPHNVIKGQFQVKGQTDWAVLCSTDKISSILIFWGGDVKSLSEIARSPDKNWLQAIADGKIGYSRYITSIGGGSVIDHYQAHGGPQSLTLDHDGIDDAFLEKGSAVHYWHDGKWLKLTRSD